MPDDFDPYHVWLGIPPDEQPANRYRLLGIRAFESNLDVIDNAADRQTVHLRTFQGGKHGLLTQRLLNEVAAARICLLNTQAKAAYDQQLRAALAASTPQSPVPSPFGAAPARAAGGSQIRRGQPANIPVAKAIEPATPQAAPQPERNWEELIGTHETGPRKLSGKSRQSIARRQASQRMVYVGVGAGLIVVAGIAALLYALNANADAALTFDWPAGDRAGATLAVDGERVAIPASGPWEFHCPPGEHRIVAQRPAFKLDQQVAVAAGDRHPVAPDWKPKAVLLLNWPLSVRNGAALTVDGRPTAISQREPIELPVEPGPHVISIRRPGVPPIETTVSVASDQRQSVSLGARRATFVIDWPAADRGGGKLMIDNREQRLDSPKLEFALNPGRHSVRIVREGFEPINKTVEIGATGLSPFTPQWVVKDASASTGTAPTTEPAPSTDVPEPPGTAAENVAKKKLPVPSDAEQKRIAKQLDEAYKTDPLPEKERALAEQLFALADQPGTSPDERYMVLMKAVGLAAKLWDLNSALHGIDLLDAAYEIDSFEIKQKVIDDAVRLAASPEHAAATMTAAEQVIEQAVAEERFDNALAMADAANKALNKLPAESRAKKDASDRLARRRREIVVLQTASAAAVEAEAALEKDPANPEANSSLGRWYCLYKGDWDRGLPLLAKGKDGTTKSLAQQELAVNLELKPQLDLADGWWDVAQKEVGLPRDLVRLHAGEIYQLMLPNLQAGVKKTAVEKRLTEIQPIVAERLSQNAARRGAWDQFDLTHAKLEDGFVRLSKDENVIVTKDGYSGALDISLIARTEGSNIRIYGPRGSSVIFNWETNPNELRVTRPDGNDSPESGSLATATVQPLAPNRWYPLRWRIAADGMEIWIAGKAVFAEKKSYDLSAKARVAVRAVDSNVDLKSFAVAPVTTKAAASMSGIRPPEIIKTERLGGGGGGAFDDMGPPGSLLVGFHVVVNGVVNIIEPKFRTPNGIVAGSTHGSNGGTEIDVMAKPGYAVGAIVVKPGDTVDGFRAVFMRVRGKNLDPTDSYESQWLGGRGGGAETKLGGDGKPVIGIHGTCGTNIDSLGLVLSATSLEAGTGAKPGRGLPSAFPRGQWVDLLRLVDATTDAVRGTWSRERGEISCKPEEACRIKLPVIIDGGYDLEVEFTRTEGNEDVNFVTPVGPRECLVKLGDGKGEFSGLEFVDGHGPHDKGSLNTVRPGTLENGRRYRMLASVRFFKDGTASIDVSLQGKPYLPHWQGKPASLSLHPAWKLPNAGQPGLAAWKSAVTFHSARLRMISGEAIPESELKKSSFGPKIMKARWGGGKNWADATVQVARAVGQGNAVRAKSDFVGADPTPGWRKHLEITYEKDGQQQRVSIDEDQQWSRLDYAK